MSSCFFSTIIDSPVRHKDPDTTPSPQEIRKRLVKLFAPNNIVQEGKKVGVLMARVRAPEENSFKLYQFY